MSIYIPELLLHIATIASPLTVYSMFLTHKRLFHSRPYVDMLEVVKELADKDYSPKRHKEFLIPDRYDPEIVMCLVSKNLSTNVDKILDRITGYQESDGTVKHPLTDIRYLSRPEILDSDLDISFWVHPDISIEEIRKSISTSPRREYHDANGTFAKCVERGMTMKRIQRLRSEPNNYFPDPSLDYLANGIICHHYNCEIADYLLNTGNYDTHEIQDVISDNCSEIEDDLLTPDFDLDKFLRLAGIIAKYGISFPEVLIMYAAYGPRIVENFDSVIDVLDMLVPMSEDGAFFAKWQKMILRDIVMNCVRYPFGNLTEDEEERVNSIRKYCTTEDKNYESFALNWFNEYIEY